MADPTNKSYDGIISWAKASDNDIKAKQLATPRSITITNNGGTSVVATAGSFDGTGTATIKLKDPVAINVTGNVTGNCSGSSGSCTGNSASSTYATNIRISQDVGAKWRPLLLATDHTTGANQAPLVSGNQKSTSPAVADISLRAYTDANATATGQEKRAILCIGNNISNADTTNDNYKYSKYGQIYMYGTGKGYTAIKPGYNADSSITLTLPSGAGTLARTSDDITGNAATATKLKTARTISLTGDVTGSGSFDGGGNLSLSTALSSFTRITTTDNYYSYPYSGGSLITSGTMSWDVSYNNFIGIAVLQSSSGTDCGFNIAPNTSRAIFMKVPSVMEENFNKFILLPSISNMDYNDTTSAPFLINSNSTLRRGPCGFIISEWMPNSTGVVVRDTDWDAQMQLRTNQTSNSSYYNMPKCLNIRILLRDAPENYLYSSSISLYFEFYCPAVVGFKI